MKAQLVVHYDFNDPHNLFTNVASPGMYDGATLDEELGDRFDYPIESFEGGAIEFFQYDHLFNREAIVVEGLDSDFFDGRTDWAFEVDFATTGVPQVIMEGNAPVLTTIGGVLLTNGIDPDAAFLPAYGSSQSGPWSPASGLGHDDGLGHFRPEESRRQILRMTDNLNVVLNPERDVECDHSPAFNGCIPGETLSHVTGGVRLFYGGWQNHVEPDSESLGRWWNASTANGVASHGGERFERDVIDAAGSVTTIDGPSVGVDHPINVLDGQWHNLKIVYVAPTEPLQTDSNSAAEAKSQPLGTYYLRLDGVWVTKKEGLGVQQIERDVHGEPLRRYTVLGNSVDANAIGWYGNRLGAFQGEMDNVKIFGTGETPSDLRVELNTDTGEIKLHGGEFARRIRSISLESSSGSLDPEAWNSFSDQRLGVLGDTGNWREVAATGNMLAEQVDGGTSLFSDTENNVVSIGHVFLPSKTSDGILRGDYNDNRVVDAPDGNVWRDNFGSSVSAGTLADGNGDGVIDTADYSVWRDNFGQVLNETAELDLVVTLGIESPNLLWQGEAGLGSTDFELVEWKVEYVHDIVQRAPVPEAESWALLVVGLLLGHRSLRSERRPERRGSA